MKWTNKLKNPIQAWSKIIRQISNNDKIGINLNIYLKTSGGHILYGELKNH